MIEQKKEKAQGYSSEKIREMKEKAAQSGARPVNTNVMQAGSCKEYYVGCNTITAHY